MSLGENVSTLQGSLCVILRKTRFCIAISNSERRDPKAKEKASEINTVLCIYKEST